MSEDFFFSSMMELASANYLKLAEYAAMRGDRENGDAPEILLDSIRPVDRKVFGIINMFGNYEII